MGWPGRLTEKRSLVAIVLDWCPCLGYSLADDAAGERHDGHDGRCDCVEEHNDGCALEIEGRLVKVERYVNLFGKKS